MASELREKMRELRAMLPSHSEYRVEPPKVHVWLYWEGRNVSGRGVATCHSRDTFDVTVGETIAYGRAVKDAAQKLLARACRPEWALSERGGEAMAPWYKCWQCEEYEPSRRLAGWGICHDGRAALQPGQTVACARFRLHEEEPPEDAGQAAEGELEAFSLDGNFETFAENPGLAERVEALEAKVAHLDVRQLASLVQNMHLDALPAVYRRLGTLEARESRLDQEGVNLRERLVKLECEREGSDRNEARIAALEQSIERREDLLANLACRPNNIDGGGENLVWTTLHSFDHRIDVTRRRIERLEMLVEQLGQQPGDNAP